MLADEVIPHDSDADSGWAYILLSTSINDAVLGPVNWLTAEVGRHVADKRLPCWNFVEGEFVIEFETLNRLVVTVVEVFGVCIDIPISDILDGGVLQILVVSDLRDISKLLCLSDGTLRPCSSRQVVGSWTFLVTKEVEWYRTKLKGSSTLEEEDSEIVRDVK